MTSLRAAQPNTRGSTLGSAKRLNSSPKCPRSPPEPTHPPNEWVTGAPTPEIKWPWREYDHLQTSSAKVKNKWRYTFIPPFAVMAFIGASSSFTSFGLNLLIQRAIRHRYTTAEWSSKISFRGAAHQEARVFAEKACEKSYNTIQYNTTLLIRNSSWTRSHRLHASFTLWKACECNTSYRKCMTFH
jgi:hypothetical protein